MRVFKVIPVVVMLAAGWSCANAAADFITIQRTQVDLNDANPQLLVDFTLPTSLNRSGSTSNSAVLDLEALGSEFNFNQLYLNPPPNPVCGDNSTDAYDPQQIGELQEHDDINLKNEWVANHMTFSSGKLARGTNTLMICIRAENGDAGPNVPNVDDVSVRNIVLHYHTSP
jgi:hypothetical protein